MVLDQPQLFGQAGLCGYPVFGTRGIESSSFARQNSASARGGVIAGLPPEVGEGVAQVAGEIESGTALGDDLGIGHRVGAVAKYRRHRFRRAEIELAVGPPHSCASRRA